MKVTLNQLPSMSNIISGLRLVEEGDAYRLYADLKHDECPAIVVRTRDMQPRTYTDLRRAHRALQKLGYNRVMLDIPECPLEEGV